MAPIISEINPRLLGGLDPENRELCTLEATVVTGLEEVACEECKEKLGANCVVARGRLFIDVNPEQVPEVLKLRSIDNVNIVLSMVKNFSFPSEREKCFEQLYMLAEKPDWKKGMEVWRRTLGYEEEPIKEEKLLTGDFCQPRPDVDLKMMKSTSQIVNNIPRALLPKHLKLDEEGLAKEDEVQLSEDKDSVEENNEVSHTRDYCLSGPKFRVSCNRTGTRHIFGSPEAARQFGAGINEKFNWPVDLKNFDLEVILYIDNEFVYVALALTREALFKRNLTNFGRTNLRATLCYNMVRLAAPKPGEVVIDPMCGGATIPIEGSLTYTKSFHLGGDNFGQAVKRSRDNIDWLVNKGKSMSVDVAQWDATRLPLREQCVDIVVSDLPFGKRIGSKTDNRVLYFHALLELARVTRIKTGRAVLLTYDHRSMIKNIKRVHTLWKSGASRTVNVGGLSAVIYILHRTSLLCDTGLRKDSKDKEKKSPGSPGGSATN
ncbi:THUMP domain-containing protein 3-like [Penaeus monodon]|uniref:THUMP domain-containing protein 3-like n=1 Tax=Penaeus monodon TaxID=6687 RepID=UPI0018A78A7D|nr:THUMP domain-containing protein 3-like [Penaeus monodon]